MEQRRDHRLRLAPIVAMATVLFSLLPLFFGSVDVAAATSRVSVPIECLSYEMLVAHSDGAIGVYLPYTGSAGNCPTQVFYGSMAGSHLNEPIVAMAATPDGGGYWLVAADGGVFNYGDAQFYGSTGGIVLNKPIVGMASTPDGKGYWLVASDGGIFAYGDAQFYGSMGGKPLNQPIVGIASDGATGGYWLAASDGGSFAFNAPFLGSMGGQSLNAPIRLMSGTSTFGGYRLIASDGGVFDFGDAQFYGSAAAQGSDGWKAMTTVLGGHGYWLIANAVPITCGTFSPTPCGPVPLSTNPPGLVVQGFGLVGGFDESTTGDTSTAPVVGAATIEVT
jgi:hypothetical protein